MEHRTAPAESLAPRRVGVMLFDGFELLDVFGPLEILGVLPELFAVDLVGPERGPVRSAQGPRVVADCGRDDAPPAHIVLVPGGAGTRVLVGDAAALGWLAGWAADAEIVASVCTGSGVLAAAGLLDGHRATSNKRAFGWASSQGSDVHWVRKARWVEDGNRWTSAGVAAGMDMTLALISRLHGEELAREVATGVEYDWHRDPAWDPFAEVHGLA